MKVLRSSPFLPAASTLQVFILFCWLLGADAASFLVLRHSFMKALRSSPFFPVASVLQVPILVCCAVLAGMLAGALAPAVTAEAFCADDATLAGVLTGALAFATAVDAF